MSDGPLRTAFSALRVYALSHKPYRALTSATVFFLYSVQVVINLLVRAAQITHGTILIRWTCLLKTDLSWTYFLSDPVEGVIPVLTVSKGMNLG